MVKYVHHTCGKRVCILTRSLEVMKCGHEVSSPALGNALSFSSCFDSRLLVNKIFKSSMDPCGPNEAPLKKTLVVCLDF